MRVELAPWSRGRRTERQRARLLDRLVLVVGCVLALLLGTSGVALASTVRQPARSPLLTPEVQGGPVAVGEVKALARVPGVVARPSRGQRPIDVPADSYAPEPVVRIGSIEIPKLGLVAPLMHGVTLRNIDRGPSHWPGSAMPGEVGNTVVAGHRVTHSHPFRHIDQLVAGDRVVFLVDRTRSVYEMTGSRIVRPTDIHIVDPTPTATATLFACHPPRSAKFRYVVHLRLVETSEV